MKEEFSIHAGTVDADGSFANLVRDTDDVDPNEMERADLNRNDSRCV